MGFREVMEEQKNLDRLCGPKNYRTPELYWPNDNYGHAMTLKLYAGYPHRKPLYALVPHGLYLTDNVFADEVERVGYRMVLNFPPYRDPLFDRFPDVEVVPCAAPYVYTCELLDWSGVPEPKGTIAFPVHSTAMVDVDTDWDTLAGDLSLLPKPFWPVTVCIHWQDYSLGRHIPFLRRGLKVVSAGHLSDPDFLMRLAYLIRRHRFACSNDVSTPGFYAAFSGLPFFLVGERVTSLPKSEEFRRTLNDASVARIDSLRELFSERRTDLTAQQTDMARYMVRVDAMKSPEALLEDLERAETRFNEGKG